MGKRKRGICTYCGREKLLTNDHVFPKSLFIKSDPKMLTVPVCNDCNQLKSLGDADLEVFTNLDIYGSTHSDNLQHIERILQRGQSTLDWLDETLNTARELPIRTESGIVVGSSLKISHYNFDRILATLSMSVRGLYFDSRHEVLPAEVPTYVFRMPWNMSLDVLDLMGRYQKSQPTIKGNNVVFWGEINIGSDNQYDSMWAICIYDAIVFIGVTGEHWAEYFEKTVERLAENELTRPKRDHVVIRPAPDGKYRLPN